MIMHYLFPYTIYKHKYPGYKVSLLSTYDIINTCTDVLYKI